MLLRQKNRPLILVKFTEIGLYLPIMNVLQGKIAAQCSHATLKAYKQAKAGHEQLLGKWESNGQPKVRKKIKLG